MKRTPLRRTTPLRRGDSRLKRTPLERTTPLRHVNRERKARLREEQFGAKAEWIRDLPCLVCGERPSDPAHVTSRGAGGTKADLVPLCRSCHREQHQVGIQTFEARHGVDLTLEAHDYHARWEGS